jgi:hypothetical protein
LEFVVLDLLLVGEVLLLDQLKERKIKKTWGIAGAAGAGAVVLFLIYPPLFVIANSAFIILTLLWVDRLEKGAVDYHSNKERIKKALYLLAGLALFFVFTHHEWAGEMFRFYILFIISATLVLRESRRYYYKIEGSRSQIANIGIMIGVMLFSMQIVYRVIIRILILVGNACGIVLDWIVRFIIFVIGKPLAASIEAIKKFLEGRLDPELLKPSEGAKNQMPLPDVSSGTLQIPAFITVLLKITIIALILWIIYRVFTKYHSSHALTEKFHEERERIERKKQNRIHRRRFTSMLERLFGSQGDRRQQILSIYRNFEIKTSKKGIFKPYFTATQLGNMTKTHVQQNG